MRMPRSLAATETSAPLRGEKHLEQRQGPAFGALIGLVFLVLAIGLIGGGWYGHTQLAQNQLPTAAIGLAAR